MSVFSGRDMAAIRAALLAFYDASARPLPWRATTDPYAIWVSEVMSQQTRVDTVIPYYQRWLQRFPDITALAEASLDDVLALWEGLGYYSRARHLHAAAGMVREQHGGTLPGTYDALRTLPGVGDYTAGAVASIAFGEAQPAVDGNVRRVLARLLDEPAPSSSRLRAVATLLLPRDRPGDFNQALMELGATVCTPAGPACGDCPLRGHCAARAAGTQRDRPRRVERRPVPTCIVATAVIHSPAGRVLVQRRPEAGLLAGLWSFPGVEVDVEEDAPDRVLELAGRLAPGVAAEARPLGTVEHTFSHRRERYACYAVQAEEGTPGDVTAWIDGNRQGVTLPRGQQRIHALALRALRLSGRAGGPG